MDQANSSRMVRVAAWSGHAGMLRTLVESVRGCFEALPLHVVDTGGLAAAVRAVSPDVLILDIDGANGGASRLISQLLQSVGGVAILAVSAHADRRLADGALAAGAMGYVLSDCVFEELCPAVRCLAGRGCFVSESVG